MPRAVRGKESPLPSPGAGAESVAVFIRGTLVGSEQIAITRSAEGWTVASSGRLGAPVDVVSRRVEVQYDGGWNPRTVAGGATVGGQQISIPPAIPRKTAGYPAPHGPQP